MNHDHETMTTPRGGIFHYWHKPVQRELGAVTTDEAMALVPERTQDGDRIAAERAQREADKAKAATMQPDLL